MSTPTGAITVAWNHAWGGAAERRSTDLSRSGAHVPVQDLVAEARTGSLEAFETLYRTHQAGIYAFIRSQVREADLAADLTQQTFVRAWEALPRLRASGAFRGWLHRIAANLVRDEAKSGRARLEVSVSALTENEDDPPVEFVSAKTTEMIAVENELRSEVRAALNRLSPEQRAVVVMHHLEGMSVAEIAGRLASRRAPSCPDWRAQEKPCANGSRGMWRWMMKCSEVKRRLAEYQLGGGSLWARARLRRHWRDRAACRAQEAALARTGQLLSQLELDLPPDYGWATVRARIVYLLPRPRPPSGSALGGGRGVDAGAVADGRIRPPHAESDGAGDACGSDRAGRPGYEGGRGPAFVRTLFGALGRSGRDGLAVGVGGGRLVKRVWPLLLILLGTATLAGAEESAWKEVWRSEEAPSHVSLSGQVRTMIAAEGAASRGMAQVWVANGKDAVRLHRRRPPLVHARRRRASHSAASGYQAGAGSAAAAIGLRPRGGGTQLRGAAGAHGHSPGPPGGRHRDRTQGRRETTVAAVAGSGHFFSAEARAARARRAGGERDGVRVR